MVCLNGAGAIDKGLRSVCNVCKRFPKFLRCIGIFAGITKPTYDREIVVRSVSVVGERSQGRPLPHRRVTVELLSQGDHLRARHRQVARRSDHPYRRRRRVVLERARVDKTMSVMPREECAIHK